MIVGFGGQLRIFFNKVLQKQNELKESALMFNLPSILISTASSSSRVEALQTTFRKNKRNTRKFKLTQQIVIPSPCSLSFKDWDQDTRMVVKIGWENLFFLWYMISMHPKRMFQALSCKVNQRIQHQLCALLWVAGELCRQRILLPVWSSTSFHW